MQGFDPAITQITADARIDRATHGWRAKCLQRLVRLGLPVPTTFAVPAATVRRIAAGQMPQREALAALIRSAHGLVWVKASGSRRATLTA